MNHDEHEEAVTRLAGERQRLDAYRTKLKAEGLDRRAIDRVIEPMESFHEKLVEEVESYERLLEGDLGVVTNLHGLGRMLVGLRIARGLTQKQLAERLRVDPSTVSRDERNEYHGITVERASRVLDALEVELESSFPGPVSRLESAGK